MSGDFCDWEPCKFFKKALHEVVPISRPISTEPAPDKGPPVLAVIGNDGRVRVMNLWYCPFCGTRVYDNKDVLEWAESQRRH